MRSLRPDVTREPPANRSQPVRLSAETGDAAASLRFRLTRSVRRRAGQKSLTTVAAARWQWRRDRSTRLPSTTATLAGAKDAQMGQGRLPDPMRPSTSALGRRPPKTAESRHCHAAEQQHTSTRWAQWTPTTVATTRDAFLRCRPLVSGSASAPWAHHSPDYCGPHVCLPALTPTTRRAQCLRVQQTTPATSPAPSDGRSCNSAQMGPPSLHTRYTISHNRYFITYHVMGIHQSYDLMARDPTVASCREWPLASGAAVAFYCAVRLRTFGRYRPPVPTALT